MSDTLYNYVDATGVIVPDTTSLKATVQAEYIAVFGSAIDIDDSAPFGILIAAEVQARAAVINNNAAIANQINPNQAAGQFLDAIGALMQVQRTGQAFSYYPSVSLSGAANLPVPAGTQAKTTNGDVFQTASAITLSPAGSGTVSMTAVNYGAIAAPACTFDIVSDVLGLNSIVATDAGNVGNSVMSDIAFRSFRRNTLSLQGRSINGALYSAIKNLPFVVDLQFLENNTASAVTTEGIPLVANSFWLCINDGQNGTTISTGGVNAAMLAATILQYKSTGVNWNGAQSASATDPTTLQAYTVKWDIPTSVPVAVTATLSQGNYTGSITANAQNAILDYAANNIDGIDGLKTGENVSPFEIASAIVSEMPGLYVKNLQIGTVASGTTSPAEITITINQIATIAIANIDIVIV